MLITSRQVSAARALIGFTQEQLADSSKVSKNTINKFENGEAISLEKLSKVKSALELRGIQFIDKSGVIRNDGIIRVLQGPDSCDQLYEDLITTVRSSGGTVNGIFDHQDRLAMCLGLNNRSDLGRLEQLDKYADARFLLTCAHKNEPFIPFFEFRATPKLLINPLHQLVYGNKVALIISIGNETSIMLVNSIETAQTNIKRFERDWDEAFPYADFVAPTGQ